jgi:hypothetical protein
MSIESHLVSLRTYMAEIASNQREIIRLLEGRQDAPAAKPAQDADSAPWRGYEDATVDEVVERLRGMNEAERGKALAYERANKGRVGITRVNWNS